MTLPTAKPDLTKTDEYVERLKLATELEKVGVVKLALRASDLDEEGQQATLDMIEYVRKAQGLDG